MAKKIPWVIIHVNGVSGTLNGGLKSVNRLSNAVRAQTFQFLVYITWMMVGRESSIPKSKVELKSKVDIIVFRALEA